MAAEQAMPSDQSWQHMGAEQLKLYASELSSLYKQERQLRQQLEARNKDLELRIRELSALNAMFQQHLDHRTRTEEALRRLVATIAQVSAEAEEILHLVEKSPLFRPNE
ncbi:MAG: hypothetical protein HYX95_01110 [Chloroflexi bacterium]|nr:hypothetical protein [Chloroflexota bacterium]